MAKAARKNARQREKDRQRRKEQNRARRASLPAPILTPAPIVADPMPVIGDRTIINPNLRWFVVQTFPGYEHRVSLWLRRNGIEHYLPADKIVRVKRGKQHTAIRYALPRHLFIGVADGSARDLIRDDEGQNAQGVHDILRLHGRDVQIQVADLQTFADALALDIQERVVPEASGLKNGDEVLVIAGPFASFSAVVCGPAPDGKVQAEVSIFGRTTPIDLALDQFEAA